MLILWIFLLIKASHTQFPQVTPFLENIHGLPNVAGHHDAQHRGPRWYDYNSDSDSDSDMDTTSSETSSTSTSDSYSSSESSEASSFETKERKMATRTNRVCTPCPQDMMKKHKNIGIKWICGIYQRARRTFKSVCMMRYRNCEDGTMFIKMHDHRCKNDTYHGRHWFYVYRV